MPTDAPPLQASIRSCCVSLLHTVILVEQIVTSLRGLVCFSSAAGFRGSTLACIACMQQTQVSTRSSVPSK